MASRNDYGQDMSCLTKLGLSRDIAIWRSKLFKVIL